MMRETLLRDCSTTKKKKKKKKKPQKKKKKKKKKNSWPLYQKASMNKNRITPSEKKKYQKCDPLRFCPQKRVWRQWHRETHQYRVEKWGKVRTWKVGWRESPCVSTWDPVGRVAIVYQSRRDWCKIGVGGHKLSWLF